MIHIFRKENLKNPTFLLLHGSGGDENDLLPLAHIINPEYNVLSVRGEVNENGMNRFFKRFSEGLFDEEDLVHRTKQLREFISTCAIEYGFDPNKVIALGYSNGANIAASILLHYSDVFSKAILFHPRVPIRKLAPNLENVSVFISAGKTDSICPPNESVELEKRLRDASAKVTLHWESNGHHLIESEVNAAKLWLQENA